MENNNKVFCYLRIYIACILRISSSNKTSLSKVSYLTIWTLIFRDLYQIVQTLNFKYLPYSRTSTVIKLISSRRDLILISVSLTFFNNYFKVCLCKRINLIGLVSYKQSYSLVIIFIYQNDSVVTL